jgi:hypothetical protein
MEVKRNYLRGQDRISHALSHFSQHRPEFQRPALSPIAAVGEKPEQFAIKRPLAQQFQLLADRNQKSRKLGSSWSEYSA